MIVARIYQADRERVNALIVRNWYTTQMVVHGEVIDLSCAEGFCAYEGEEIVGLVTYCLLGSQMEMLSLDSLREGCGVGTALLGACVDEARSSGATRVFLVTTNDNLRTLRFSESFGSILSKSCDGGTPSTSIIGQTNEARGATSESGDGPEGTGRAICRWGPDGASRSSP